MATVKKETKVVAKTTAVNQKDVKAKEVKPVATKKEEPSKSPKQTVEAPKKTGAKKYHIAQRSDDGMWQVKAEGAEKALKLFKTQQEAIDYAKKVADNQEGSIMIHKKDGSFRKLTY